MSTSMLQVPHPHTTAHSPSRPQSQGKGHSPFHEGPFTRLSPNPSGEQYGLASATQRQQVTRPSARDGYIRSSLSPLLAPSRAARSYSPTPNRQRPQAEMDSTSHPVQRPVRPHPYDRLGRPIPSAHPQSAVARRTVGHQGIGGHSEYRPSAAMAARRTTTSQSRYDPSRRPPPPPPQSPANHPHPDERHRSSSASVVRGREVSINDPLDVDRYTISRGAQRDAAWRRKEAEQHQHQEVQRRKQEMEYAQLQTAKEEMRYRLQIYERQQQQILQNHREERRQAIAVQPNRAPPPVHRPVVQRPPHQPLRSQLEHHRSSVPNLDSGFRPRADVSVPPRIAAKIDRRAPIATFPSPRNEVSGNLALPPPYRSDPCTVKGYNRRGSLAAVPAPPGHPSQLFRRRASIAPAAYAAATYERRGSLASGLRRNAEPLSNLLPSTLYRERSVEHLHSHMYRDPVALLPKLASLGSSRDPNGRAPEGEGRKALLREQEVMIGKARKAMALASAREAGQVKHSEKAKEVDGPARKRSVQLQVFVHARPTYCRWGDCRAVLHSWELLEKHIHKAHIKHLPVTTPNPPPSDGAHGSESSKSRKHDHKCHWGDCAKTFNDKERMYRHTLMEHMGEFCARCPFNCLFEGPTFPSLMAHVSRRHPTATPDDFVPGLIHFAPAIQSPPPLPVGNIDLLSPDASPTPAVLPSRIVAPYPGNKASQAISTDSLAKPKEAQSASKRGSEDRGMSRAEKVQQSKSDISKKVAGRVISEVVRLAVAAAAAERWRALSRSTSEVKQGYMSPVNSDGEPPEEAGTIDIKSIVKAARASVKAESISLGALPGNAGSVASMERSGLGREACISDSDGGTQPHPVLPIPTTVQPADVEDAWAKLGFGTRTAVGNRYVDPKSPASKITLHVSPAIEEAGMSSTLKSKRSRHSSSISHTSDSGGLDTESDRDSMDYVPDGPVGSSEPVQRETRRTGAMSATSAGGLSVKVEPSVGESGSGTPSPSASSLKIVLKLPKEEDKLHCNGADEDESRRRSRPRRGRTHVR